MLICCSVPAELKRSELSTKLHRPFLSQPLCTAIQVALVDLLRTWHVVPTAVCGHSSGEIAAAYCAGALTRETAWKIAYFRGIVAEKLSAGAGGGAPTIPTTMMSVGLSQEQVLPYLASEEDVSVACINSPINVTLSGTQSSIDRLFQRFDKEEIFAKKLTVKIGYHSKAMLPGTAEYRCMLGQIEWPVKLLEPSVEDTSTAAHPKIAFYSSVTGEYIPSLATLHGPAYWVENLVSPVQFARAFAAMVASTSTSSDSGKKPDSRHRVFIEIGPQPALRRPVQDNLSQLLGPGTTGSWRYVAALKSRTIADSRSLMELMGELWASGVDINLGSANFDSTIIRSSMTQPCLLVDLPSYPFSRAKEYWEESRLSRNYAFRPYRRHALLGIRDKDWNPTEPSWKNTLRVQENSWMSDHAVSATFISCDMLFFGVLRGFSSAAERIYS